MRLLAGVRPEHVELETLYYRFIVRDGTDTVFYGDNTAALDGGLGATSDDDSPDWGYALTIYEPSFAAPSWMKNAFIYQIFPDRFRNGNPSNDPVTGQPKEARWANDPRYAYPDGTGGREGARPVLRAPVGRLPRGLLPQLLGRRLPAALAVRHRARRPVRPRLLRRRSPGVIEKLTT